MSAIIVPRHRTCPIRKHPTMAAVLRCAGYLLFAIHRHLKVGYPSRLWWQFRPRKRASTQSTQPPIMPSHPKMQTKMRHLGMTYLSVSRTSDCLRDQFLALLSLRESKQIRWKLEMQSQASRWTSGSRNGLPILDDLASGKAMFLSISEC